MTFKIIPQDAGMGEHEYIILKNGQFYAYTDSTLNATEIVNAVSYMERAHPDLLGRTIR